MLIVSRTGYLKTLTKNSWWLFRTLLDEGLPFCPPSFGCANMSEAICEGSEKRKLEEDGGDQKHRKKIKQETKALKAKRPGFTEERYNETSYYVENGLRKVYPYYFTFTTFCKGRWVGQPILEVFAKEFRAHPPEEYERCIRTGTLTVNYKVVDVDYKLQHNDLLANTVHRHEVPVAHHPIRIVHECDDLIVVDKPPSIPVHPCGRYRHNSVVFILAKEFDLKNLRTIHRLDRLTSGLLLFGRTVKKARQLEHEIRSRLVSKEYVCRVEGQFPSEPIVCEEPIEVVSYKIGVCRVGPKGKDCKTEFQCLSFNGKTSVVLCKPKTGRMHQIRVHLQYLGYPIINDPLYNHPVFGPEKGKAGNIGKSNEMLIAELINIHNAENWLGMDGESDEFSLPKTLTESVNEVSTLDPAASIDDKPKEGSPKEDRPTGDELASRRVETEEDKSKPLLEEVATKTDNGDPPSDPQLKTVKDPLCYECKVKFRDPKPEDLVMFLHAWRYKGPEWEYETKLPAWASEDWEPVVK